MSTENITQNWYTGNDRSMLIPNVLFRLGGAGILLTNKSNKRSKAKYVLQNVTRVHLGADDESYRCHKRLQHRMLAMALLSYLNLQ